MDKSKLIGKTISGVQTAEYPGKDHYHHVTIMFDDGTSLFLSGCYNHSSHEYDPLEVEERDDG